jgi:hypothetical protein
VVPHPVATRSLPLAVLYLAVTRSLSS